VGSLTIGPPLYEWFSHNLLVLGLVGGAVAAAVYFFFATKKKGRYRQ